jgi:PhnB protein
MPTVKPIPEGYHSVTPYLVVTGASKLIDFMKQAFGAQEIHRMAAPDGTIMHAEVKIGDSHIMVGEAGGPNPAMPTMLYLYVTDTDATYKRALAAGATSEMEPKNQFYGDRNAGVKDASGNRWYIATHVEDVAPAEMEKRAQAAMKQRQGA